MWQDWAILACQIVMLFALWPTLRDRARWPHPLTATMTAVALSVMGAALGSLDLYASGIITAALGFAWARMAWQ
jgi:hypothetical protein